MNQQAKNKRSFPYVGLILILTAVLVIFVLGYTLMESTGILGRMDNAVKSDNFRISENHMDVYRFHAAQYNLQYEYMYILYGLTEDPTGGLAQYMDAATYVNYMLPQYVGTGAFDETAYGLAEQYVAFCEGAKEAGLYDQYKADVQADIDEYIEGLRTAAETNGLSFSGYLKNFMGTGVSKGDIETAMEYYFIGIKHDEKLYDDFKAAVTDTEINTYVEDNKGSFYTTEYSSYKLVNESMKEALEDCATVEDVKAAIVDYYMEQKFDTLYETNFTTAKVEDTAGKEQTEADVKATVLALNGIGEDTTLHFTESDTDAYKKAAYAIVKALNSSVTAQTVTENASASWVDPEGTSATPLQKWLFNDGRISGDHTVLETKSTTSDGTELSTYTWYLVGDERMKLDKELTKNAHYIQLTDDAESVENGKTAKEKAEAFHAALTAANTAEKFAELVEQYAPGYSSELVEYISYESMKATSEDLADWLYDDRAEGDVSDMIEVTDSNDKVTGYIIALYMGENEETWKVNATNGVATEKRTDWLESMTEKYNIVVDYSHEGHDHDEETAA